MGRTSLEAGRNSGELNRKPTLLFDGVCHLCHGSVKFLIKRDKKSIIQYAALQSDKAKLLISNQGYKGVIPDGVILIEGETIYFESDAVLRCLYHLGGGWRLLSYLRFIPKALRRVVYRMIARNRYKWFGKYDTCVIPQPGWKERFVDQPIS
ncbi:MAG: thiol-disulfide oxidoreductase DCC family protein [Bacteroidia bacterium]